MTYFKQEPLDKDEVWILIEDYYHASKLMPSKSYLMSLSGLSKSKIDYYFQDYQRKGWLKKTINGQGYILLK